MVLAGVTEEEQAEKILAVLNDAIAPAKAFEYGTVPGTDGVEGERPAEYLLIDLSRRYVDGFLSSGEAAARGGRLGTRYVAQIADNASRMRQRVTTRLEDKVLEEGLGPFVFESSEAIGPDSAGYVSGADVWIF